MGLSTEPTMPNAFLLFYEMKCLEWYLNEFKSVFYRQYVNDIFVLFESTEHLPKFHAYLNTCHCTMSLSFEQEVKVSCCF